MIVTTRRAVWAAALVAPLALIAATQATGSGDTPTKAGATVTPDYTFGAWDEPDVCVLDQTDGMPVADATAAFDGTPVAFEVRDSCAGERTVIVLTIDDPDAEWAASTDTVGLGASGGEAWLRLNTAHDQPDESWQRLLVHELGHAVGLDHTHRHSVMNVELIYELDGLTRTDHAVLEALYGR